jgi:hypothetical protein
MSRRLCVALFLALPVLSHRVQAQTSTYETSVAGSGYEDMADGETRDVPCEYTYYRHFAGHSGIDFEGYLFLSDWRSKRSDFPLPSWNWYYALPSRNPVSSDGKARWDNAEIQVHCWIYRAMYILHHHRDVVAAAGQLVELCEGDWRIDLRREDGYDDGDGSRLGSSRYDPYARSSWGATQFCADDSDGGGGGAGGTQYEPGDYTNGETVGWSDGVGTGGYSACGQDAKVEYVCIDVWIDGLGWVEWSCGYTTTC